MATREELASKINQLADRADKAKGEIVLAVQELKDQISNADASTPEIDAALARLDGSVAALDELNPDAETPNPDTTGENPTPA